MRLQCRGCVRDMYLGYMCKKARTVAKGLSAGLFVPIIREAIPFSHTLFLEFDSRPPVVSRYAPIVRVNDSCMPSPNKRKMFFNISL
jgi:hypothetical protein